MSSYEFASDTPAEPLVAYCLEWHLTMSDAFRDILVRPLAPHVPIALNAWDGDELPPSATADDPDRPVVFCQLPPPRSLLDDPRRRIVWLPMWDHAARFEQAWWDALPKTLRIVAFSEPVARRAARAGLPVLRLRYFVDPAQRAPVSWTGGTVLLYWNRAGLASLEFLRRTCEALQVDELLFRPRLDPRMPADRAYDVPERLGGAAVRVVDVEGRDAYAHVSAAANVFFAPRLREGVGITFLEALARGCPVLGADAPTMNEYVDHGTSGFLFRPPTEPRPRGPLRAKVASRLPVRRVHHRGDCLSTEQDWGALARLDLGAAGAYARAAHDAGHRCWQRDLPRYAAFLAEW